MTEYIYLLQEREFVKSGENIYKIGKTKQPNLCRILNYPIGTILIIQLRCKDCDEKEKEIINHFKQKYKQRRDIGSEYFEGDCDEMSDDIIDFIKNGKINITNTNINNINNKTHIIKNENIIDNEENNTESDKNTLNSNEINNKSGILIGKKYVIDNGKKFYCDLCNYSTEIKANLGIHLQSKKHILKEKERVKEKNKKYRDLYKNNFKCNKCHNTFSSNFSLKRHLEKC